MRSVLKYNRRSIPVIGIFLISMSLAAQAPVRQTLQTISFSPGFVQIKDEYNYGLVNNGFNLSCRYALASVSDNRILRYEAGLGLGLNFKKGAGMAASLKPFDLFYGFRLTGDPSVRLTLGPYLSGYYLWQLYPELQAGHMFWMSSYEIGPRLLLSLPVKNRDLNFSLSNSIAGFNSRPDRQSEEYYYSLKLADFAANPHSNMTFGSLGQFSHTRLVIDWTWPTDGFTVSYEYEFMAYMNFPSFRYSLHTINLTWKIGNKNAE